MPTSPWTHVHRSLAAAPLWARSIIGALALSIVLTSYLNQRVSAASIMAGASLVETRETMYVPDERTTRALFLGYDQAAGDLLWLRAIEYFARHFTSDRQYPWLPHLVDQIIALDPRFRRIYHWAGASVLYGQTFTDNNVRLSNRFYEAALKQFPDDGEAATRLGLNYYVEMRGRSDEDRRRFQEKGKQYLEMAANMPGASPQTLQLVAGVGGKLGDSALAIQSLLQLLENAQDEAQRAAIRARIETLVGDDGAGAEMAAELERFETRRRAEFEYVSPALFLLMDSAARPGSTSGSASWRALLPDVSVRAEPATEETP